MVIVIIVLVIAAAGLLAWYFLQDNDTTNVNTTNATNGTAMVEKEVPPANTVWIVDGSFNPSVLTVSAGDTVTWINKDAIERQVASDPHPTHTDLQSLESDILGEGDQYSYTFDTAGEWGYHDHLNPIKKGIIVVK